MREISKMNVLQIADYNAPYSGNFIASLESLNNLLVKNRNRLFYLFPEIAKDKKWIKDLKNQGQIIYFYTDNPIKNILLLRKILVDNNINIMHIHFRNVKIALPVTVLHLLMRKTLYFTHLHGTYVKSSFVRESLRKLARLGTNYIGCSKIVSEQAKKGRLSRKKIYSVENSIDFTRLNDYEVMKNDDIEIGDNTKKILMFGYNWHVKGVDLALEAVKKIIEEKRDVVLLISVAANKDKLEDFIIRKYGSIPKWVILLEPRNDIATYYKFSDVFISPSREEGFCYSLVEASYCKRPIVASSIPAQKNLKLSCGIWVEPNNINSLKTGIEKALDFNEWELLDKQKQTLLEHYQMDRWAEEVLSVYNEVGNRNMEYSK